MLKFIELEKRKYVVVNLETEPVINADGSLQYSPENIVVNLDLHFSSAINKFEIICEFMENISKAFGKEFDDWFIGYLNEYKNTNYDYLIIKKNIPIMKEFVNRYVDSLGINFENYINKEKVSKSSIFFDAKEIKQLILTSDYLKMYYVISHDSKMKLPTKFHREIFKELVKDISESDILFKLFKVVSSKIYKYNITDSYMWEYIKIICCKTTDMHIMSIFNFVVNNILVICKDTSNPIPFIISVIDSSIQWMLKSVYKDVVIYSDHINTEDVYHLGKDNLRNYAYNDSIGRLVLKTYNALETEEITDISFSESIKDKQETPLIASYITYPILCKVMDIPYRHFNTIPCEHGYLLNILLYQLLSDEFKTKYPLLCEMLLYYNTEKSISKTTYKIKNIKQFTDTLGTFLGFKNAYYTYSFYSRIMGKISRNTYYSFKNNKEVDNIPIAKLEFEVITFLNDYFDGRLKEEFETLKDKIEEIL